MRFLPFICELWGRAHEAAPGDGRAWERDVRELLVRGQLRSADVPGGYSLLGAPSASGLWHQLDLEALLDDAILIAELKAYRGRLPKSDLLEFVAATDDLFLGLGRDVPRVPLFRAVAGAFEATAGVQTYAAQHGVLLINPALVPAPLLAAGVLPLPPELAPPSPAEIEALASLVRPIQAFHRRTASGALLRPAPWPSGEIAFAVRTQVDWSVRLAAARMTPRNIREAA